MADESHGNRQGGKRRRYFRRKGNEKPQGDGAPRPEPDTNPARTPRADSARGERPARPERSTRPDRAGGRPARAQPGHEGGALIERHGSLQGGAQQGGAAAGRNSVRRRRRNKNRRGDLRSDQPVIPAAREPDYHPPQSVFIYTHTVRPGAQGYEFRSEHFSKVGRTLEEYAIDLSSLFDADGRIQLSRIAPEAFANLVLDDDEAAPLPPALEQNDVGEADDSRFDDTRSLPTRDIDGLPGAPPVYGAEDTPPPSQTDDSEGPTLAVSE